MDDIDNTLQFAATLIHQKTQTYCSELQRRILISALQEERETYDQLAEECGYSPKYVKQDVAPKLWQLFSQVLGTKVNKANVRAALEQAMRQRAMSADAISSDDYVSVYGKNWSDHIDSDADTLGVAETKATILLVDDQPQNLRLLSELLEEQGYDVQQAINGTVALQAIGQHKPHLVLLDIYMPELDGYSVCQQIKADPMTVDIPVIFVSALDEAWDKVKAFSAGGSDYITKPFKVVEVLARVENQLKIRQLQLALRHQNLRLQQAIQELQRLAAIDEITQVASRRRFDDYLLRCWKSAASHQEPLTLMFLQLDYFSASDHAPGQAANNSDRTLKCLAQLLQQTVQDPQSLVCRYGTLTFALILPHSQTVQSLLPKDIASQVIERAQSQCRLQPEQSLSIGIATMQPSHTESLERLISVGQRNLQQASVSEGSCIVASTDGLKQ